jgi:hypothetical protein
MKYGMRQKNLLPQDYWLYLCFLAPFAVIYPWVITSGPPMGGYGGVVFFTHWLTKYPNFGPVNIEVLIGMVCVIGVALLPALFANTATNQRPNPLVLLMLFVVNLIMFVPVFIRLDLNLWITGLLGQTGNIEGLYGPALHTAPFMVMTWYAIKLLIRKPASGY